MSRSRTSLIGLVVVIAASVMALTTSAGASDPPQAEPVRNVFDAFSRLTQTRPEPELERLSVRHNIGDFHVLGQSLGRSGARLVAGLSADGATVCYGLLGGPGSVSYCYPPLYPNLPKELAGQHFHAVAPEALVGGEVGVQLYGVAFDDVVSMRAQVAGEWRSVPLFNNGFYLDVPGVRNEQVGIVEATLADGSKQIHDIQAGS